MDLKQRAVLTTLKMLLGKKERGTNVLERLTLSNSGSQESKVNDRTLEQWTPKLLACKDRKWKTV